MKLTRIVVLLFIGLLLNGCALTSDNCLRCKKIVNIAETKYSYTVDAHYEGELIDHVDYNFECLDSNGNIEEFYEYFDEVYGGVKNKPGVNYSINKDDNSIVVTLNYDLSKINAEEAHELYIYGAKKKYKIDEFRKNYESNDYNCK